METISCEQVSLPRTLREFFHSVPWQYQVSLLLNHWRLTMSEINEYSSNGMESRGENRVINYPNLSESSRLKRKRKMETETTSPRKRGRTENEVS